MTVTQQNDWHFVINQASEWDFDVTQTGDWYFVCTQTDLGSFDPDAFSPAFDRYRQ